MTKLPEPKTPWEFVAQRLPRLKPVSASVTLWNGGSIFETTFLTLNRCGIARRLRFESSDYGLDCPSDVAELTINPQTVEGKKGLAVQVRSPTRNNNRGTAGWEEHRTTLESYFGPVFVQWAELAVLRESRKWTAEELGHTLYFQKNTLRGL